LPIELQVWLAAQRLSPATQSAVQVLSAAQYFPVLQVPMTEQASPQLTCPVQGLTLLSSSLLPQLIANTQAANARVPAATALAKARVDGRCDRGVIANSPSIWGGTPAVARTRYQVLANDVLARRDRSLWTRVLDRWFECLER
jgi:hypothetical protein